MLLMWQLLVQRPERCPSPPAPSLSHDQNECILRCKGAGTVYGFEDGCNKIHCVASKSERQDQVATSPATEFVVEEKDTHAPENARIHSVYDQKCVRDKPFLAASRFLRQDQPSD
jgi:hypothetical protein